MPALVASIVEGGGGGKAGGTGICGGGKTVPSGDDSRDTAPGAAPEASVRLLRDNASFKGLVVQGTSGRLASAAGGSRAAARVMDTVRRVALARAANRTLLYTSTARTPKNSTVQPTMTRATT